MKPPSLIPDLAIQLFWGIIRDRYEGSTVIFCKSVSTPMPTFSNLKRLQLLSWISLVCTLIASLMCLMPYGWILFHEVQFQRDNVCPVILCRHCVSSSFLAKCKQIFVNFAGKLSTFLMSPISIRPAAMKVIIFTLSLPIPVLATCSQSWCTLCWHHGPKWCIQWQKNAAIGQMITWQESF